MLSEFCQDHKQTLKTIAVKPITITAIGICVIMAAVFVLTGYALGEPRRAA